MPEIVEVFTVQRRLFAPDAIPWTYLATESNRQLLQQHFRFAAVNLLPDPAQAQIAAIMGEFIDEGGTHPVQQLLIGPNFAEFQVTGPSHVADAFFENVAAFIGKVGPESAFANPSEHAKTYQTIVIARLNFPYDALLSTSLRGILRDAKSQLSRKDADVALDLERLSWRVTYKPRDTNIQYLPRELRIEPRNASLPDDRLYYTQSPSDFETHMGLLTALEKALA